MWMVRAGLVCLLALTVHGKGWAEPECRDTTPAETAAVARAGNSVKSELIDKVSAEPWQANLDSSILNGGGLLVSTHPGPYRPLMLCSDLVRLTLDYAAQDDYANGLRQKQIDLITEAGDMAAKMTAPDAAAEAKMKSMMAQAAEAVAPLHADIDITENDPYLVEPAPGQDCLTIKVIGADFAYRCVGHDDNGATTTMTYVEIGPWAGAKPGGAYAPYPFVHKTGGPWIETLRVRINAPATLADQLVAKVNWQGLHDALTP